MHFIVFGGAPGVGKSILDAIPRRPRHCWDSVWLFTQLQQLCVYSFSCFLSDRLSIKIYFKFITCIQRRCIFFNLQKCIPKKLKRSSKFQSDPSSNCFTIDFWKIKWWIHNFILFFLNVIGTSFYTSSVVFWYVIFWE